MMRFLSDGLNRRFDAPACGRASFSRSRALRNREALLSALAREARANAIFAISEISKGVALVAIGDLALADLLGEFICLEGQTLGPLASGGRVAWIPEKLRYLLPGGV
jgi:hypothetical protein